MALEFEALGFYLWGHPLEERAGLISLLSSSPISRLGECAGGTEVVLVRINGGGHTWPAGRFSLPAAIVGPTSFAVDASGATGQFFAAQLG